MHEGHRKRMMERLAEHGESLQDHELLEILLFNAIPRKNTNEIAHALLDRFGSLSALSEARMESLETVDGVGRCTACYLRCVFALMDRMKSEKERELPTAKNLSDFSELLKKRLRGIDHECIVLIAVGKNNELLGVESYSTHEKNRAQVAPQIITRFFAEYDPKAVVIAHNHLCDPATPSESDDLFTRQIQALCSFHGIPLYDHIVVSPNEVYSYHACSRFDYVGTIPLEPLFCRKKV